MFIGSGEAVNEALKLLKSDKKDEKGKEIKLDKFELTIKDGNYRRLEFDILKDNSMVLNKPAEEIFAYVSGLEKDMFRKEKPKYNVKQPPFCGELDEDCFYVAKSSFVAEYLPEKMYFITEDIYNQQFVINGVLLKNGVSKRLWDFTNVIYDVTGIVKKGENLVVVTGKTYDFKMPYVVPFAAFNGDFGLDKNLNIVKPSYKDTTDISGIFPQYSGEVVYETEFKAKKGESIVLSLETADSVSVYVNDALAGEGSWAPYEIDISAHLKDGKNTLKIVLINTMSNLFNYSLATGIKDVKLIKYK